MAFLSRHLERCEGKAEQDLFKTKTVSSPGKKELRRKKHMLGKENGLLHRGKSL